MPHSLRYGAAVFFRQLRRASLTSAQEKNSARLKNVNSDFRRVRNIAKSDCLLRHVRLSEWNDSTPTGQILMKFVV
jgi:hypothetical protein